MADPIHNHIAPQWQIDICLACELPDCKPQSVFCALRPNAKPVPKNYCPKGGMHTYRNNKCRKCRRRQPKEAK